MNRDLKIALVQDALPFIGGAEKLLEAVLEMFPEAPIFTLFYNPEAFKGSIIRRHSVQPSFINRLPGARRGYRNYLPLFPLAIEQFDLSSFDVILSFSYAAAHGVLAVPGQRHISFTYTPLRQAWHQYHQFVDGRGLKFGFTSWPKRVMLHYLRLWDLAASQRVDQFAAVSHWVAGLIWRAYRRSAQVIYPPVDVQNFQPLEPRDNYYICVSRLARRKKLELLVAAFTRLGLPFILVGEGPEDKRLRRLAGPNIRIPGWQPDRIVQQLLGRARAFVHVAEEEFGIAMVEAQAAGCPVIAYGKGGAAETVVDGQTGLLFNEQSVESVMSAVEKFEFGALKFDVSDLRRNAERFNKKRFQQETLRLVMGEVSVFENQEFAYSRNML